jgi:hypothetical protein
MVHIKTKLFAVHNLVGNAFLNDDASSTLSFTHISDDTSNNSVSNLVISLKDIPRENSSSNNGLRKVKIASFQEEPGEQFVEITSAPRFHVSNKGRVVKIGRNGNRILLKQTRYDYGLTVMLIGANKKRFRATVHQLVGRHFLLKDIAPSEKQNYFFQHIDAETMDNSVSNIRAVSRQRGPQPGVFIPRIELSHGQTIRYSVKFDPKKSMWISQLIINKKAVSLGVFDVEADAVESAQEAVQLLKDQLLRPAELPGLAAKGEEHSANRVDEFQDIETNSHVGDDELFDEFADEAVDPFSSSSLDIEDDSGEPPLPIDRF